MAELRDLHIEVAEAGTHDSPHSTHRHEDRHIPQVVEHAGAVESEAVGVQPEIAVPPEVSLEDLRRVLLQNTQPPFYELNYPRPLDP